MSAAGYTTIYNRALRDIDLSLTAKGLYAVIKSFIGLPDFQLSKRRLSYTCSDSDYQLQKAWKELKTKGYLQHYFSQSENGAFSHAYNLMQQPGEPVNYVYSPDQTRPNGDCACIVLDQKDYTNISTAVLRDKTISLASKGLYALVAHLQKIPQFVLRPEGVRSFCQEKVKHFATLWKKFKLSGLLKQHRFPAGEENRWTYTYELCETPDLETPYLTNYHIDGSVSTAFTIHGVLEKLRRLVRPKASRQPSGTVQPRPVRRKLRRQIETQINADALRRQYGRELTGTLVTAVCNLSHADRMTVKGAEISRESRQAAAQQITPQTVRDFLDGLHVDFSRIGNPAAYLQAALYTYLQKLSDAPQAEHLTVPSTNPQPALSAWEQDWLQRVKAHRSAAQETE